MLKNLARTFVYPLALALKADRLLAKPPKHRMMILMYHGVTENNLTSITTRHLTSKDFEKHLRYLKQNFDIIPLRQLFDLHRNDIVPKRNTIAITFDDGFVNNFTTALPLLELYKTPASFFISAICVDDENYILWSDLIDIIRAKTSGNTLNFNDNIFEKQGAYGLYSKELKTSGFEYIKHLAPIERNNLLKNLMDKYEVNELIKNIPAECYKLLNKKQLFEFSQSPYVEIGSHGYSHLNLANIPLSDAEEELRKSKQKLEEVINKEVISIAYPDGNYNNEVKSLSLKLGYKNLLAVNYLMPNDVSDNNILPRQGISNTTTYAANMLIINRNFHKIGF